MRDLADTEHFGRASRRPAQTRTLGYFWPGLYGGARLLTAETLKSGSKGGCEATDENDVLVGPSQIGSDHSVSYRPSILVPEQKSVHGSSEDDHQCRVDERAGYLCQNRSRRNGLLRIPEISGHVGSEATSPENVSSIHY